MIDTSVLIGTEDWDVTKRNGDFVTFDAKKIWGAINCAVSSVGIANDNVVSQLTYKVISILRELGGDYQKKQIVFNVEQIQEIVEDVLIHSDQKKAAKEYIIYRDKRRSARDISEASHVGIVNNYLSHIDWRVLENSNMSYSLQGLNNHISSEISKTYWLNKIYSKQIKDAHISGDFHIHDLGLLSVYCVGWDLIDLLLVGFGGVSGKIASKPARHLRSLTLQIVNFMYTLQGEAAGAQAFSNFDTLLAPFIRYDNLTEKEVYQTIQEFIFNLNIPTRVGFQTPFTNFSFDLEPPSYLKNQHVIIGGELQKETYGMFQEEMNLLNRVFMEVMSKGDANERIFTFPIPTYNITKDFNWENKNLETLWETTAKYGVPYFANFVNSDMSPDDIRSMCCRLRIETKTLRKRGGGLFGSNPLTGSIGVVTINMPRIAYLSKNHEEFNYRLLELINLSLESLKLKRKTLESMTEGGFYPYSSYYLRDIKKRTGMYWSNHFSTIGVLGMHEAAILQGGDGVDTKNGSDFAEKTLKLIRKTLLNYQDKTGNVINLEATPAEGTSYRLTSLDNKKYPDIKEILGYDKDRVYTNSSQLPVDFGSDIFKAFDLQDRIQSLYTGGTVLHVFLGESIADPNAVKSFIKTVCDNYKLPYFSLTPTFSICPTHGYLIGEIDKCSTCGEDTEIYSRVVGYCRPIKQWNKGKKDEFSRRVTGKI